MRVLGSWSFGSVALLVSGLLAGCVIAPSLSVDNQDAGVNSPPAILAVRSDQQELPEGENVIFDQGPTAGKINVELIDTDVNDTLYVSVFVDYTLEDPSSPRSTCKAAGGSTVKRSTTCDLTAVCMLDDIGKIRNMTVAVFDREPLTDGSLPSFKALPEGGLSASKFFFLKCKEPPS